MNFSLKESTAARLTLLGLLLLTAFFVLLMYMIVHEGGHALVGLAFGGAVTEFYINPLAISAHVGIAGTFSPVQDALKNIAGAGLPWLLWLVFILAVPRQGSSSLEILKVFLSVCVVNTFLVWVILPILYAVGQPVIGDDVTWFLQNSGFNPWLFAAVMALIYGGAWVLFLRKIPGIQEEVALLRNPELSVIRAGAFRYVAMLLALMVVGVLMVVAINATAAAAGPLIPAGYQSVALLDLNQRAYEGEVVAEFSWTEGPAGVFVIVQGIDTPYVDLKVEGPMGKVETILHGEDYSAFRDTVFWEQHLMPGIHQVVLTSQLSPGTIEIFVKK